MEKIPELAMWAQKVGAIVVPRKGDQDKLDAAICALTGLLWRTKPHTETMMVGDLCDGDMNAPASADVRSRIKSAALSAGVKISE